MPKKKNPKNASLETASEWDKKYKCKLDCDVISKKVARMR